MSNDRRIQTQHFFSPRVERNEPSQALDAYAHAKFDKKEKLSSKAVAQFDQIIVTLPIVMYVYLCIASIVPISNATRSRKVPTKYTHAKLAHSLSLSPPPPPAPGIIQPMQYNLPEF